MNVNERIARGLGWLNDGPWWARPDTQRYVALPDYKHSLELMKRVAELKKRNKKLRRQLKAERKKLAPRVDTKLAARLVEREWKPSFNADAAYKEFLADHVCGPDCSGFDPALADVAAMFRAEMLRTEQEANGVH